jgi:hypothetical protein
MKKILVPLAIILLFAALIAGGAYAAAQITTDPSSGLANRTQAIDANRVAKPAPLDGAAENASESGFGRRDGRHDHDDLAFERALPELLRNLLLISLVVLLTAALQKATRWLRRRGPAQG